MRNYQSSFDVIDLKLDIEHSLSVQCMLPSIQCRGPGLQHAAHWSLLTNINAQAAGVAYHRHYTRVSKQAGAFRVHSSFGICFAFNCLIH